MVDTPARFYSRADQILILCRSAVGGRSAVWRRIAVGGAWCRRGAWCRLEAQLPDPQGALYHSQLSDALGFQEKMVSRSGIAFEGFASPEGPKLIILSTSHFKFIATQG